MKKISPKNIILSLVLTGVLFVGYNFFLKPAPTPDAALETSSANDVGELAEGREILTLLARLEAIHLSGKIFATAAWRALIDQGQPLGEEPVGRPNPFAPIGAAGTVSSGTTTQTTPKTGGTTSPTVSSPSNVPVPATTAPAPQSTKPKSAL